MPKTEASEEYFFSNNQDSSNVNQTPIDLLSEMKRATKVTISDDKEPQDKILMYLSRKKFQNSVNTPTKAAIDSTRSVKQVVVRADDFSVPPAQYEAFLGEQPQGGKSGEEGKF
ncbi:hypothetical protein BC332_07579 [Capsicum chinense]|nr:hypothetical protein BC332_07579 [Capsicum chinense]